MRYICIQNISVYHLSTYSADQLRELARCIALAHLEYRRTASISELELHAHCSHEFGVTADAGKTLSGKCQRLCDRRFWFEKLSAIAGRTRESIAVRNLRVGSVKDGKEPYCSDESLSDYLSRQERRSVSTPTQLKSEVAKAAHQHYMTAKALAFRAYNAGFLSLLITLCPDGRYRSSCDKYQGYTFDHAHSVLHGIYKNLIEHLSKHGKSGTDFFGVRCIEVHEDGCPHWHILLYIKPELLNTTKSSLQKSYRKQSKEMGDYFDACHSEIIKVRSPSTSKRKDFIKSVGYIFKNPYSGRKSTEAFTDALRQKVAICIYGKNQYQFIGTNGSLTLIRQLRNGSTVGGIAMELSLERSASNRKQRQFNAVKHLLSRTLSSYQLIKVTSTNRYGEQITKIAGVAQAMGTRILTIKAISGVTCNSSSNISLTPSTNNTTACPQAFYLANSVRAPPKPGFRLNIQGPTKFN